MRLDEIKPSEYKYLSKSKMTGQDTVQKILKWLDEKGFKQIGKGLFSCVFNKDNSQVVVKIETNSYYDHSCYREYAKFAKTIKSPNFPKISRIVCGEFYIYMLEKLTPLDLNPSEEDFLEKVYYEIRRGYPSQDFEPFWEETKEKSNDFNDLTQHFLNKMKNLYDALFLVKKQSGLVRCGLDLSKSNVMQRLSDREFVVTDPWGFAF